MRASPPAPRLDRSLASRGPSTRLGETRSRASLTYIVRRPRAPPRAHPSSRRRRYVKLDLDAEAVPVINYKKLKREHDAKAGARPTAGRGEDGDSGTLAPGSDEQNQVRSIHWFPYDRVGDVNADP